MFIGLAERGFRMTVMCSPSAQTYERLSGSKVRVLPFEVARRYDRAAIRRIREELESLRPHILHLFENKPVLNGLVAARGSDAKIVVYRGNVGNVSFFDPLAWLRYLNPRIDRIVCVSESVREYLAGLKLLSWRLPPGRLVTIHKGHDLSWYQDRPVDLAPFGVPADAFVVGCVANWRPRKGIEVLIRACGLLADTIPLHLVLVGDRMPNASLAKAMAGRLTPDRVHFAGHRLDAPAVAAAFDVAVLPALKREGLPRTVIEAMAYGVASIASAVGGVAEIIEDGVSGIIVPPGDAQALAEAIARLHDDAGLCEALGRRGKERIRTQFRIEDTIEKTAALYQSLVGS